MRAPMLVRSMCFAIPKGVLEPLIIHYFPFPQIQKITRMEQLWRMRLRTVSGVWEMNMRGIRITQIPRIPRIRRRLSGRKCLDSVGLELLRRERRRHLLRAVSA